jgi:F-type H+-transporting ATPase subunit epsilon
MTEISKKILLQIVTPVRSVVYEEVDIVELPGADGYFGVLPGHTPFLSTLRVGEVKYRSERQDKFLALSGGFAEILPDKVTVLADLAEKPEDVDVTAAQEARKEAAASLQAPDPDFVEHQAELELAQARLGVTSKTGIHTTSE